VLGYSFYQGVIIGRCIIGTWSVISKNVEECQIVAGNPAKKIGVRNKEEYFRLKKEDLIYLKLKKSK